MHIKFLMIFLWLLSHCHPVCQGCLIYNHTTATTTTTIPPPETVQMCFVGPKMARNSMRPDNVLLNIQIIRCKPAESCFPAEDSEYYGMGLGYVFFKIIYTFINICDIEMKEYWFYQNVFKFPLHTTYFFYVLLYK